MRGAATRSAAAPSAAAQRPAAVARRAVLAVPLLWAAAARAEGAPPAPRAGGVDEASSPFIAEALRKTEAQREARVRERLDAYYVKNFKDYFGSGFGRAGTSPETQAAIDAWMEKNAPEKK